MKRFLIAFGYSFFPVIPFFISWIIFTLYIIIFTGLENFIYSIISLYVIMPAASCTYSISFVLFSILGVNNNTCKWLTGISSLAAVIALIICFMGIPGGSQTGNWN